MALILRNGGSQSPDRWLKEPRNNHSLFMWSATAGFILSGKVNGAHIEDETGNHISWGGGQYMRFGFINYVIQLSIALIVMLIIL